MEEKQKPRERERERERERAATGVYAPQNRNGTARRGVCYFIIDALSLDTERRAKSIRCECRDINASPRRYDITENLHKTCGSSRVT